MSVSLDCEMCVIPIEEEKETIDCDNSKIHELSLRKIDELVTCIKSKGKGKKIKGEAKSRGSFFSIITGVALIGIGAVVSLAAPTAGGVIIGTGVTMIANTVCDEINEASKPQQPKQIDNGGTISVGMPI